MSDNTNFNLRKNDFADNAKGKVEFDFVCLVSKAYVNMKKEL